MSIDATRSTWKLTKTQVTPTQKIILLSYADRANEDSECWPSNKRLEMDTGLDRHTICANKQILIEKGLLSYTGEKKGKTKSIDVIRLNYVARREDDLMTSSGEMPIAKAASSGEMPIAKQWGNAHTEPKSLLNLKVIESMPTEKAASPPSEKILSVSKEVNELIDAWNEIATRIGCPAMGKNKRELNAIKRYVKEIKQNWEMELCKESFELFLNLGIEHEHYMLTKFKHPLHVILRWSNFESIYKKITNH